MTIKLYEEWLSLYEAGASAERQENGFIQLIKDAVKEQGSEISIKTKSTVITNVIDAVKYTGRQAKGSEPYTDVQLILKNKKTLNISMKGDSAPSLAGGGLSGIEEIIPNLGYKFYNAAYKEHIKNNLNDGDKVPDIYAKLNDIEKKLLVIGNSSMGGPIDFMYIGPMDVTGSLDNKILTLNGNLINVEEYANKNDLFFRLRARRNDQVFDKNAKYPNGTPKIYSKSPSKGDSAGRIVVTDKPVKGRDWIVI